jgi:hypothetical protein
MRLTIKQLRSIIAEETRRVLRESEREIINVGGKLYYADDEGNKVPVNDPNMDPDDYPDVSAGVGVKSTTRSTEPTEDDLLDYGKGGWGTRSGGQYVPPPKKRRY